MTVWRISGKIIKTGIIVTCAVQGLGHFLCFVFHQG